MNSNALDFKSVSEDVREMYDNLYESYGIRSFSELAEVTNSTDALEDLSILTSMLHYMLYNIMDYSDNKNEEARKAIAEYVELATALLDEGDQTKEKETLIAKAKKAISDFIEKRKKKKKVDGDRCIKSNGSFMVWKDKDDNYRWIASYSNNYRDDDNPREIIAKESHVNFVEMVDNGEAGYPELWHWHTPGTTWGKADWVAFDEENGIAMASGYIEKGHEAEAEALMGMDIEVGVSHGMPKTSIVRDTVDKSVIRRHVTVEISDLPKWAAANQLTSFYVFEEKDSMGIPDQKKEYLRKAGLTDDVIAKLEQDNAAKAKQAAEQEIESKEASAVTEEAEVQEQPVAESVDPEPVAELDSKEQGEPQETVTVEFVTKETLLSVIEQLSQTITTGFETVAQKMSAIEERVSSVETKEQEMSSAIPTASLSALIAQSMTATKSKETVVRKNNPLASEAPTETEAPAEQRQYSNNPLANAIISGVLAGDK